MFHSVTKEAAFKCCKEQVRKHPKNKKEHRGRKRIRKQKYKPTLLANGETEVEMLARSGNMLAQSGDKWGDSKKEPDFYLNNTYR